MAATWPLDLECHDASAAVIEEITFESGSIGPFNAPADTGWSFDVANVISGIGTANGNRPAFQNGTNNEAFLINPYVAPPEAPVTGARDRQGAVWEIANDTDAGPPETFDAGEVFYTIVEQFSDIARGGQRFSSQFFIGPLGNGIAGQGGFSATSFDSSAGPVESSWSWGDDESTNSGVPGINGSDGMEFVVTRYPNPPTAEHLAVNHTSISVLRHGVDSAAGFTGTEMEISETLGNFNGGDAENATDFEWGGNVNEIAGLLIDKATMFISRQRPAQGEDIANNENTAATSPWIDIMEIDPAEPDSIYNTQIGIKYLRFGTAELTDINMDGLTDAADFAIAQSNLGLSPTNNPGANATGATWFDGDIDNDLDVDQDDLDMFPVLQVLGDFNGDGDGNFGDLSPAVLALTDPDQHAIDFPTVDLVGACDTNGDNTCNFGDLSGLVDVYTSGAGEASGSAAPEPGSLCLLLMAAAALGITRPRRPRESRA